MAHFFIWSVFGFHTKSQLIFREFQFHVLMTNVYGLVFLGLCTNILGYPKTILKMAVFFVGFQGWLTMRCSEILGDPILSWPIFARPIMPAVVDRIRMGSNFFCRRPAPKMRRWNKASWTLQGLEHLVQAPHRSGSTA